MNKRTVALAVAATFAAGHLALAQGPLNPPGPPAATMKSLDELDAKLNQANTKLDTADGKAEKRTPISSLPFTITAPGSYYLTGNLTGTAGQNGISVDVDEVTIDLNGFKLSGPGDNGIVAGGRVTIRNGMLSGWAQSGITATGPGVLIQDIQATSIPGRGISGGARAVVQSCTVSNSGTVGGGRGIAVGDGSIVSKCTVTGTTGTGSIAIAGGIGSIVADCTGRDNDAATGNVISVAANSLVLRCEASASAGVSAAISTGTNCRVIDCIAANNTGATTDGIFASTRSLVSGCSAAQNGRDGIVITDQCVATNNTASQNAGDGFEATGSRNRIESNHASGNTGNGFRVNDAANTVGNLIIRNSSGANTALEYNVAAGNAFGPVAAAVNVANGSATNPHANFDLD